MKLMHPTSLFAFAMLAIFALAFAPMANAQGRPCTADIMCKTGQFCLNNQCTLRTCSWRDDDMACSKFNATTWCQKEGGQCVPRTALANAACEPQSRDNSCSEGLVCDPANSKCVDAAQFVQSFWEKNKTYIIIGIVVVLALGCCAIACFCCVVKKGVGFAGRLMKK
ncbi:hypothetical protein BCR44DRAFT_55669 [Catenaria anguillulae PL171]|uniref:Uncharacterized protein n=1 Tax=Catenaria anguillulae PL171 TaxID=765915 RepID=A0A1Y2HYS3_9FUNG|nr:hypothetical protein BCR44DRAFT_55669 [Catenaria anguillulae PL171]